MTFTVNQVFWWEPIYFRWDRPALVEVIKLYRCGAGLLSNGQTADKDGFIVWKSGILVGRIYPSQL